MHVCIYIYKYLLQNACVAFAEAHAYVHILGYEIIKGRSPPVCICMCVCV